MENTFDLEKIELIKKMICEGRLPQFVYKYYKLNNYTEKVLSESKIWFGSPLNFNDPFDCQLTPNTTNTEKEIEGYLKANTSFNRVKRREAIKGIRNGNISWREAITNSLNKITSNSGITSFCGSNTNILMWSHYSDSHKGICLKFDLSKSPETFLYPIKIIYTKEYPTFNFLNKKDDIIEFLFQTKSDLWEYESELRVVKPTIGAYPFSKKSLTEITFGCKTDLKDIEKYIGLLKDKNYHNCKVTKTKPSPSKFTLELIDINT